MREIKSPYFVLKAEFKAKGKLEFEGFIEYITRDEAKQSDVKKKSQKADYQFGNSKLSIQEEQYLHYLSYMYRKSALEQKAKLSPDEIKSMELLGRYRNDDVAQLLEEMKKATHQKEELQTGMFDFFSYDLSVEEVGEYKKKFEKAQKANSVMYKDVLSFSTEALISAGLYNPYKDTLNRKPLIEASRLMLQDMYKREGLGRTGISVGEIHYNTNFFHIHFATVESENTRRLIEVNGELQARGLRKESTLQAMKSVFANHIFDRTNELALISKLRDGMREGVKVELKNSQSEKALALLSKLKHSLPLDKRQWNSKNLSDSNSQIMQDLIDELMSRNSEFNRYKRLARQEDDHRQKMYGKLAHHKNSFYEGRMFGDNGVYYRLGNSILEDLRRSSQVQDKSRDALTRESQNSGYKRAVKIERVLDEGQYLLKRIKFEIDNTFAQYKIEQERYEMERDVERAKWEQTLS